MSSIGTRESNHSQNDGIGTPSTTLIGASDFIGTLLVGTLKAPVQLTGVFSMNKQTFTVCIHTRDGTVWSIQGQLLP